MLDMFVNIIPESKLKHELHRIVWAMITNKKLRFSHVMQPLIDLDLAMF